MKNDIKGNVIALFLQNPNRSIQTISKIIGCSPKISADIISEHLESLRTEKFFVEPKRVVEPFVLMTHNEAVLSAYHKMINPIR